MQSFVINLEVRPERMAFMRRQLDNLKIDYSRVDAIDGLTDSTIYAGKGGLKLSGGEYACYLSHLKAYAAFLKTDAPLALILEDDMALSGSFVDALAFAVKTHRRGGVTRLEIPIQSIIGEPSRIAPQPASRDARWSLWRLKSCVYGLGAYLIDRDLAQKMLADYSTPELQIDMMLLCENEIMPQRPHIFQISPPVAIQNRYLDSALKAEINESDLEEARAALVAEHIKKMTAAFHTSLENSNPVMRHLKKRKHNFIHNTTAIYQRLFRPVVNWIKGFFGKRAVFRFDGEALILPAADIDGKE